MRCLLLCALAVASSAVAAEATLRDELLATAKSVQDAKHEAARKFYVETFKPRLINAARGTAGEGGYSCAIRVAASECPYNDCLNFIVGTLFAEDPDFEGFDGRGPPGILATDASTDDGPACELNFDWE